MTHELPKRFILYGPSQMAASVNWIKTYTGDRVQIDITKHISDHSDNQRGYFFMCCGIFAETIDGLEKEHIVNVVKKRIWGTHIVKVAGFEIEIFNSLAKGKANKMDYIKAIDTLLIMADEAGVYLPEPEKQW